MALTKVVRDSLLAKQRHSTALLTAVQHSFDRSALHKLSDFSKLVENPVPERVQQLLRLTVRNVAWDNEGRHKMRLYAIDNGKSFKASA